MNAELIALSVIVPCILVFFNVIVLARYIDPEAAAGHYIAKLMLVRIDFEVRELHYASSLK